MPRINKIKKTLRCTLNTDEKLAFSEQLARANQDFIELTADKVQVAADFKARMTAREAEIGRLSGILNNGYENRQIEVVIHYNEPIAGQRQEVRTDTGEVIHEGPMNEDELQEEFDMEVKPA